MKAKILTILTLLALTVAGPALMPSAVTYAACDDTASKKEIIDSIGQTGSKKCDDQGVTNIVSTIVGILSYVAGIAAIIMIIVSGFRYITSGGDAGKVSSAKNTLIYAAVGIVIAALAQVIIRFVITQANSSTIQKSCSPGYHRRASDNNCVPD